MTNTTCSNPALCGVQTHRPATISACQTSGSQPSGSAVGARLSGAPALATEKPDYTQSVGGYAPISNRWPHPLSTWPESIPMPVEIVTEEIEEFWTANPSDSDDPQDEGHPDSWIKVYFHMPNGAELNYSEANENDEPEFKGDWEAYPLTNVEDQDNLRDAITEFASQLEDSPRFVGATLKPKG